MLELPLIFKWRIGFLTFSIAKTTTKKTGALIHSVKFLSSQFLLIFMNLPPNHGCNHRNLA